MLSALKDDNGGQEADGKKKKKKNKERAVMSLNEFRQLENGTVAADGKQPRTRTNLTVWPSRLKIST